MNNIQIQGRGNIKFIQSNRGITYRGISKSYLYEPNAFLDWLFKFIDFDWLKKATGKPIGFFFTNIFLSLKKLSILVQTSLS